MPKITTAVRDYRVAMMRELMDRCRLDALVFTTPDFFQFATNFQLDVWPWERPVFAVVPRDGEPFAVMNELSTNHMRFATEQQTVWLRDVTYYAEHPRVSQRLALAPQLPELLASSLRARPRRQPHRRRRRPPAAGAAQRYLPELRCARHWPRCARCAGSSMRRNSR